MAVTRERFEQGMTYDEYKAQMTRNKERFEQTEARFEPDAETVALLRRLPGTINVLVLAEDWCGDVINNLPLLGKLAQASGGKLNLRIFLRDQNDDLMSQYLNQGKFKSIPVFAFFDENMRQIGVFIERPASVTAERDRRRRALFAEHPEWGSPDVPLGELPQGVQEQVQAAMLKIREELFDFSNAEVVREIRAILEPVATAA